MRVLLYKFAMFDQFTCNVAYLSLGTRQKRLATLQIFQITRQSILQPPAIIYLYRNLLFLFSKATISFLFPQLKNKLHIDNMQTGIFLNLFIT